MKRNYYRNFFNEYDKEILVCVGEDGQEVSLEIVGPVSKSNWQITRQEAEELYWGLYHVLGFDE